MFRLPARRGRPGLVVGAHGAESEPCCATATGAVALALGDDGGLGWRDAPRSPRSVRRTDWPASANG